MHVKRYSMYLIIIYKTGFWTKLDAIFRIKYYQRKYLQGHVRSYLQNYFVLPLNTITYITANHYKINVGKFYCLNQKKCRLLFLVLSTKNLNHVKLLWISSRPAVIYIQQWLPWRHNRKKYTSNFPCIVEFKEGAISDFSRHNMFFALILK
jgi:hypothetical protein